jgi:D-3-phosphoglycerate dehydrogenase
MHRVVLLDDISQDGIDMLKQAGMECEVRTKLAGEDLRKTLAEFDGAIVRSGAKITAESLEGNRKLRAIVRAGVGTDNIDKVAATRQGIIVMNTPTGNTISTAEHAFALMLALSRNLSPAYESLKAGRWDRKLYMGSQLADKTLGIVGMGRIGQEVAKRAKAFKMRVIGCDPFFSADQAESLGVQRAATVDELLPQVDYLTVHTPATPETINMIDKPQLEKLKPGVRLINCARGGIYNEAALVEGLKSGKIAGVSLDVYPKEPCTDSPLFGMDGVLCTPHLGASTEEAQAQVAIEAVELLVDYLNNGAIRHAVNMTPIDPKTLESLRGYLNVAYRLGLLMYQWHGGAIDQVGLNYRGEVAEKETSILTSAFCAGLMENALKDDVNVVNSVVLCKERGIELSEKTDSKPGAFSSSITAKICGGGKSHTAGGTLFGNDMPRLFRLGDHRLEAYLDGTIMIFHHQDVPGIIGHTGSVLGKHNVNIAQMSVGRDSVQPGGEAIGVLNLDGPTPQAAIDEVCSHEGIHSASVVQLPAAGESPSWLQ